MAWAAFALLLAIPVAAAAPEPPYRIQADNMTGGRGPEGDVLFLNGDLVVTRGRTRLTADQGRYLRSTGMIFLEGRVRLIDSSLTVTCDRATFNENDDRLNLDGRVEIREREAVLRAPFGWWDRRTGEARLMGGVEAQDRRQRLVADEASFDRASSTIRARGRVRGVDDENQVELEAAAIDYGRETRLAEATGDPVMRQRDADGRMAELRALRLRVDGRRRTAEALDSVRIVRDSLRAAGRYAFFDDSTGRGLLLGEPRAFDDETVVRGDTLETWSERRRLTRVVVRGGATMDYAGIRETTRGETSRLTGERVEMFLRDNRIDSLVALGGARNRYAAVPKEGRTPESNMAEGDTITIHFRDRKIERARVTGGARGEYRAPVAVDDSVAAVREVIQYSGRAIVFEVPRDRIVLDRDAQLTYNDLQLQARRVVFDSNKQTLVAEGKPQLIDKGDRVDGHLMTYDLESRSGNIYEARTAFEKGLYRGEQIRKTGENELHVRGGSYSTCDVEEPHYHFSARWMKIQLKERLVARPIVFYLRNVPILALPFYVFPLKPGRHSGFLFPQFEFGFSDPTGQFVRNAGYYWAPSDYFDLTFAGDYYQAQPAWLARVEGNYKLLYAFDGRFDFRFQRDERSERDDYTFQASHQQEVTPRTRLIARGDFVSSRAFSRDPLSGSNLGQRLDRFLTSTVSLSHAADWAAINLFVDRRQDLDATTSIEDPDGEGPLQGARPGTFASLPSLRLSEPSLSLTFPTRTLGSWGFLKDTPWSKRLQNTYATLSARFLSLRTQRGFVGGYRGFTNSAGNPDSTTVLDVSDSRRRGLASTFSLSDSRRWLGWLNLAPSVSGQAVVFDFDETGRKVVPAAVWNASVSSGTSLFRTLRTPLRPLALRHVVSPSVSIQYSPEFRGLQFTDSNGVRRNRFNSFGDIGISGFRSARLAFGLDQRIQAKWTRGDRVTRLDNLLVLSTTGSYNLLWREQGARRGLSPLSSVLRVQPPGYLSADLAGSIDPYEGRPLRTLSSNLGFQLASSGARQGQEAALASDTDRAAATAAPEGFRDSWQLSAAVSHSGGYAGPTWRSQTTLNSSMAWQLTRNWRFGYTAAYDLTRGEPLTQSFSVSRQIHCWDATFFRTFSPSGQAEYYFRLGITEQREIYYERGTRVQSFGGIN